MEVSIQDISELTQVTTYLTGLMSIHKIFLLKGDLGAGKTTLVKHWMEELKVSDTVSSPTFSLVNEYIGPHHSIYHMDMYRLEDISEAYDIGIEEYLYDSEHHCIIEWPGIIMEILHPAFVVVEINVEELVRTISIQEVLSH